MLVVKRDSSKETFDLNKIHAAVEKASSKNLTKPDLKKLDKFFEEILESGQEEITVDEIHNYVKIFLIKNNFYDIAESYILEQYRKKLVADMDSELIKGISEKLNATNVKNQNANVDEYSFGGRIGEASRYVTKEFALNYCMSKKSKKNHLNNEVYIHDLDSYAVGMHNCLSVPFDDLLAKGFNTRQTDVRPANSVNTAFQLVAVLFQLQSLQQFGGVSATHLDWTMVPYVRKSFYKHYIDGREYISHVNDETLDKDKVTETSIEDNWYKDDNPVLYKYALDQTEKELKQAVEGMYHNLNTLQSRSGNQLPFTSINYGTCTSKEGQMVTKALLEGSIKGVGKFHKTPIFPCGIFQYMKGVNDKPGTPNYELYKMALESTSKRLYPNYANVDWSGNAGYDINDPRTYFSTMGKCKLQLIEKTF